MSMNWWCHLSISWVRRSPGKGNGNTLQYSCLENPMNRGTWWATVHGVTKNQTQLLCVNCNKHTHCYVWVPGVREDWSESCSVVSNSLQSHGVHRILQARVPEWVAFPFSRGPFQPRDREKTGRFLIRWRRIRELSQIPNKTSGIFPFTGGNILSPMKESEDDLYYGDWNQQNWVDQCNIDKK